MFRKASWLMNFTFKYRKYAEALYDALREDAFYFYKRLGYEVVDRFHEPTTDADYWLMIRDMKKG
jgi:hypothetical protein